MTGIDTKATKLRHYLAQDHTYTRYYPLMYGVAEAKSENLKATIFALRQAMAGKQAEEAIENLRSAGVGSSPQNAANGGE